MTTDFKPVCVCSVFYLIVCPCLCLSQTGWSALLAAVYMGNDEIVLRLLDAGARPDIQDKVYCIVAKHIFIHLWPCQAKMFRIHNLPCLQALWYTSAYTLEVRMNVYLKCLSLQ